MVLVQQVESFIDSNQFHLSNNKLAQRRNLARSLLLGFQLLGSFLQRLEGDIVQLLESGLQLFGRTSSLLLDAFSGLLRLGGQRLNVGLNRLLVLLSLLGQLGVLFAQLLTSLGDLGVQVLHDRVKDVGMLGRFLLDGGLNRLQLVHVLARVLLDGLNHLFVRLESQRLQHTLLGIGQGRLELLAKLRQRLEERVLLCWWSWGISSDTCQRNLPYKKKNR